jgi:hypothetical protein
MTDIVERLRDKWQHNEDDCYEAADEIERLREALREVVDWAEDLGLYADAGTVLAPVFVKARTALEKSK